MPVYKPLHDHVLVRAREDYVAERSDTEPARIPYKAVIMSTGPACDDPDLVPGARVMIRRWCGYELERNGREVWIVVEPKDILVTIHDAPPES